MISVNGLTKKYGSITAIQDLSFDIRQGEILGFLGPNGAGKTTTIRILTCFIPPTSGTAFVAGYDIFKDSLKARNKIGYLPENVPLYSDMSVRQYLDFMASLKGIRRKMVKKLVEKVVESCQLIEVKDQLIFRLSKGFKQRVGLAQAIIHDPEVLILDEPTIGLDPNQILKTRELIKNNAGSKTVLISTHILPEVSQICDRVIIIDKGKIIAFDTPDNLAIKVKGKGGIILEVRAPVADLVSYLKTISDIENVESVTREGDISKVKLIIKDNMDIREKLSILIIQKGWGLLQINHISPNLEDIFHRLTTEEKV
jgi:ABC-2 type transport system ATP-binding protein